MTYGLVRVLIARRLGKRLLTVLSPAHVLASQSCGLMNNRRKKVPSELKDKDEPFMMIETPYDALVAIWDLLEGDAFTSTSDFAADMQS